MILKHNHALGPSTTSLRPLNRGEPLRDEFIISSISELRELIPSGSSGSSVSDAAKVLSYIDDQMIGFIQRSPLVHLATVDPITGNPFISPKGGEPGFVEVVLKDEGEDDIDEQPRGVALRIPDRPGNRLLFGLQNILQSSSSVSTSKSEESNCADDGDDGNQDQGGSLGRGRQNSNRVGLIFEIPGNETTLRCGGPVTLTCDPNLLQRHTYGSSTSAVPQLLLHVEIEYAFFHCAKAYIRSRVWDVGSWPGGRSNTCNGNDKAKGQDDEKYQVRFGRYFHKKGSLTARVLDDAIELHYKKVSKAVQEGRGESM